FIAMLNANGTLDTTFDLGTGPDERVGAMSVHSDGSLYLPGRLQTLNGLSAANLARVKFGPTLSAITGMEFSPRGESILSAAVFPGGVYKIQKSNDLKHWTEATTLTAEGFSRENVSVIPGNGPHEFLRFLNE